MSLSHTTAIYLQPTKLMVRTILQHRPPPVDIFCHTNRSANSMAMITIDELTENALDMMILTLFYERRIQQSTIIHYTSSLSATSGGDPALSGSATSGGDPALSLAVIRGPLLLGMTLSLISICSNCWFRFSFFSNC